jgi:hypothetical protein
MVWSGSNGQTNKTVALTEDILEEIILKKQDNVSRKDDAPSSVCNMKHQA